jgi:hypothetical protein
MEYIIDLVVCLHKYTSNVLYINCNYGRNALFHSQVLLFFTCGVIRNTEFGLHMISGCSRDGHRHNIHDSVVNELHRLIKYAGKWPKKRLSYRSSPNNSRPDITIRPSASDFALVLFKVPKAADLSLLPLKLLMLKRSITTGKFLLRLV